MGLAVAVVAARLLASAGGFQVIVVRLAAALVDKIAAQFQVTALPGRAVELNEGQLDLLVAGIAGNLAFAGPEHPGKQVGVAANRVQQRPFAGRFGVGDAGLDQVSGAVELMPVAQVREAFVRFNGGEMGVEVAVRLLGRCDQGRDVVEPLFQFRVRVRGQGIACGFHPFGDV